MDNGERTMDNGQWIIDNGQWTMENCEWTMENLNVPTSASRPFGELTKCRRWPSSIGALCRKVHTPAVPEIFLQGQ